MFYADFLCYKNAGVSITGLEYSKINLGPVPYEYESIINKYAKEGKISYKIKIKGEYERHKIKSLIVFNENLFNSKELQIINNVKNYFKDYKFKDILNYVHKEKVFTEINFYQNISYDYAFDINDLV